MDAGSSWSGHERNCCYLNLDGASFADVSALSGLDFTDDGRAVAAVDWDHDGDLDLWYKNRSGPQLRFMRNDYSPGGHYIAVKLSGTSCNRDGVGATVEVHVAGRRLSRTVTAGDAYLSQSSKWLHFGLADSDIIDRVVIRWPGGDIQEVAGVRPGRHYRVTQGGSAITETPRPRVVIPQTVRHTEKPPSGARIVLRRPLPLPASTAKELFGSENAQGVTLVGLWAQWCAPCLAELREWNAQLDRLERDGIRVVALNVDKPADRARAREFLAELNPSHASRPTLRFIDGDVPTIDTIEAIIQHVRGLSGGELSLPTGLLIDAKGTVQVVYVGRIELDQLSRDVRDYGLGTVKAAFRGAFPGRWYFKSPRNLAALAAELRKRGRVDDARFYLRLDVAARVLRKTN